MKKNNYDVLADLLKGIGIISVVMGHSGLLFPANFSSSITAFLYLYHLMIFFFVAGMLYRPEKYPDPYLYIGRQLKSAAPLFIGYNLSFLLFHNIFSRFHLVDLVPIDKNDFIISAVSVLAFKHTELLTGALWFVPMFLFSKALFAVGFQSAEHCPGKRLAHIAFLALTGWVGLYTSSHGMNLHFNLQTSLLGIPVIYLGYLFQKNRSKWIRFANPLSCIISAILLGIFVHEKIGFIDLSKNEIISIYWFYPVTVLGMFFCVSLAESIRQSRLLTAVIAHIGSVSFHIMALHFFIFKCFDLVIGKLLHVDLQTRMSFPTAFDQIGWFYSMIGIGIPVFCIYLIHLFKKFLQKSNI